MSSPGAGTTAALVPVALLLCSGASTTAEVPSADPAPLTVSPVYIPVTSTFHGSTLAVDIAVASGSQVALKVEGARSKLVFNRKGRSRKTGPP